MPSDIEYRGADDGDQWPALGCGVPNPQCGGYAQPQQEPMPAADAPHAGMPQEDSAAVHDAGEQDAGNDERSARRCLQSCHDDAMFPHKYDIALF